MRGTSKMFFLLGICLALCYTTLGVTPDLDDDNKVFVIEADVENTLPDVDILSTIDEITTEEDTNPPTDSSSSSTSSTPTPPGDTVTPDNSTASPVTPTPPSESSAMQLLPGIVLLVALLV